MQFKPAFFVASTFAILAAASSMEARTGGGGTPPPVSQCNTGSSHCCESSGVASSYSGTALWPLISAVVSDVSAFIGVQCSPIVGGGSCDHQPFCCTNNNYQGVIVVGCSPIIIS